MDDKEQWNIVVVGAGMVAHRFVESILAQLSELHNRQSLKITIIGEESHRPYDRVGLSSYFSGSRMEELTLGAELFDHDDVEILLNQRVTIIDAETHTVTTSTGHSCHYDDLVLATGSYAATIPIPGVDAEGSFVYRTYDDVEKISQWVATRSEELGRSLRGAVIGGGLLGLEAAGALSDLGVDTSVLQAGGWLMPAQLDEGGGRTLNQLIESQGLSVVTDAMTESITTTEEGAVSALNLRNGDPIPADIVILSVGVRPSDSLAREAGIDCHERGGIIIDAQCHTHTPHVYAIGEVASFNDLTVGLVAPGYVMAEVAAHAILGGSDFLFSGFDLSTKLKLSGVEVASFGDAFGTTEGALEVVHSDPVNGTYKKLVLTDDATTLLGGILVGDASAYSTLRPLIGTELSGPPAAYLISEELSGATIPQSDLPDSATVCSCNNVTAETIRSSINSGEAESAEEVKSCTKAGDSCGSCFPLVSKIVARELESLGKEVSKALCGHFEMSREQLYNAIAVSKLTGFTEIIERFGTGRGCDICKPTIANILSSLGTAHVLDGEMATLQDTNDHVMANMQKDGSYSVVPRIPGGEVTPEGLLTIGQVAKDYGLYTKITGGQRIDMFGARFEQLPAIWKRLTDAGFESGQAYGKSLRTVKSCVGSTWCRYGVQDSVGMAIHLELRYRGLRSPHKIKLGVSGCARECAEARSKDVGVIATENGWNIYVGGNGGFTPRHAQLLVEGVNDATLIQTIDRLMMYYIRTSDRLQRTAAWVEDHEGGLEAIREVIIEDSLGICADLDTAMERHVDSYEDEWKATLEDPERLQRFVSFVNAPEASDPALTYVKERGQIRPATEEDNHNGSVLIAGPHLEVKS